MSHYVYVCHLRRVFFDVTIDGQSGGRIVMELFDEVVPRTARNFYSIASGQNQQGFTYRGTIFHRIIPQFMLQVRMILSSFSLSMKITF